MFGDLLLNIPYASYVIYPTATNNVALTSEPKTKPHNVQIKKFNPKEPKAKPNIKYSAKQSYRQYKSIAEPNLHSKVMVDDNDDMVNKIQEAFEIKPKTNTNFTEADTAKASHQGLDYIPSAGVLDDKPIDEYSIFIRQAKTITDKEGSQAEFKRDTLPESAWDELAPYMIEADKT
jgi:hypothetical protein